jgi:hypothetical protein
MGRSTVVGMIGASDGVVVTRCKEIAESAKFRQNVEADACGSVRIDRLDPWLGPTGFQLPITWAAWVGHRLAKILNRKNRL